MSFCCLFSLFVCVSLSLFFDKILKTFKYAVSFFLLFVCLLCLSLFLFQVRFLFLFLFLFLFFFFFLSCFEAHFVFFCFCVSFMSVFLLLFGFYLFFFKKNSFQVLRSFHCFGGLGDQQHSSHQGSSPLTD